MNELDRQKNVAVHRRGLIKNAEDGDVLAARALLQHAMAYMRGSQGSLPSSQAIPMHWLADGIKRFLGGESIERALQVEQHRGPRREMTDMQRESEDAKIWNAVEAAKVSLIRQGVNQPLTKATRQVAKQWGVSVSTISAARTRHKRNKEKLAGNEPSFQVGSKMSKVENRDIPMPTSMLKQSMAYIRGQSGCFPIGEVVAMEWLANGIERFLKGEALEWALRLDQHGGRPKEASKMQRAIEAAKIWNAVEAAKVSLIRQGVNQPLTKATRQVAKQWGVSVSTISAARTLHKKTTEDLADRNPDFHVSSGGRRAKT